ncbi:hypothetical protein G7Y89_g2849 [Cudoniella acicularis]|uniref:Uncharacterized protein n=1 Tax=Cudoniella acicularis TaxID=354080 RepID=A0A8H4RUB5_9HELO|nr:hypothetical protein G7Y89_g2849 [Cudoniella acicularis]
MPTPAPIPAPLNAPPTYYKLNLDFALTKRMPSRLSFRFNALEIIEDPVDEVYTDPTPEYRLDSGKTMGQIPHLQKNHPGTRRLLLSVEAGCRKNLVYHALICVAQHAMCWAGLCGVEKPPVEISPAAPLIDDRMKGSKAGEQSAS